MACPFLKQVLGSGSSQPAPVKPVPSTSETSTCTAADASAISTGHGRASNSGKAESTGRCPFAGLMTSGSSRADVHKSGTASGTSSASGSHHGGLVSVTSDVQGAGQSQHRSTATSACPLGFSSSGSGIQLSSLHCMLCKALIHNCVHAEPCGHKFCRFCVSRFADCPACGRDIERFEEDEQTQGLVEQLLAAHGSDPSSVAPAGEEVRDAMRLLGQAAAQASAGGGGPAASAAFFLQLGMQSYAGGNLHAAYDRLELCRQELIKAVQQQASSGSSSPINSTNNSSAAGQGSSRAAGQGCGRAAKRLHSETGAASPAGEPAGHVHSTDGPASSSPAPPSPSPAAPAAGSASARLACQLGAVYGTQGDCCKRMGELDQAARLYELSAAALEPHAGSDAEAAHALSVSVNKLGDVRYLAQDLAQAADCYSRGLELRMQLLLQAARQHPAAASPEVQQRARVLAEAAAAAPAQALDVVMSQVKLADAHSACGQLAAAAPLLGEAQVLLDAAEQCCSGASAPPGGAGQQQMLLARCGQLRAALQQQQEQLQQEVAPSSPATSAATEAAAK